MKRFLFSVFVFLLSFSPVLAATTTGFIPGQIWFSVEAPVEGETIRVYTAVWNSNKNPISAHVEFYDSNVLLGSRDVSVDPLRVQDVSITWKVTAGDHALSAKISSSTMVTNGKKENVSLGVSTTAETRTHVPVALTTRTAAAVPTSTAESEFAKVATTVKESIPDSITAPLTNGYASLDTLRSTTSIKITDAKKETQKEIDVYSSQGLKSSSSKVTGSSDETKPLDATGKPIAYIKLFFLSVLSFIFNSSFVFYGVLVLLALLTIRFIYRKIRNR